MSKILLNGDVDFNNKTATNLATPVNATDVANKKYVDDIADGITENTGESLNQKVNKSGDTMTGALTIGSGNLNVNLGAIDCYGAITSRNGIVKAQSFESGITGSGVTVPSLTGVSSGSVNYGWTSNVPIILPETQDSRNNAAVNKGYVDNNFIGKNDTISLYSSKLYTFEDNEFIVNLLLEEIPDRQSNTTKAGTDPVKYVVVHGTINSKDSFSIPTTGVGSSLIWGETLPVIFKSAFLIGGSAYILSNFITFSVSILQNSVSLVFKSLDSNTDLRTGVTLGFSGLRGITI